MIQERIQAIISQRQPLALRVMKARENLSSALDSFGKFSFLCREILQNKELAGEFDGVLHILGEADKIKDDADKCLSELSHIQNRLTRPALNIAVIGRTGQGKSRLLQTITGLSAEEIPDGKGSFCTGARSDIINEDIEVTYADVKFLTEENFVRNNITPYFDALRKYSPEIFPIAPVSISEFRNLGIPAPEDSHDTLIKQRLQYLASLQKNLPAYENLLGQKPLRIKKEEIRLYVAQDDKDGNRGYCNHLAVESVEIHCRFPNSDVGALRLIDLPGLGDSNLGLGDDVRLLNALEDQVDFVLFLSKPSHDRAGWLDTDTDLYRKAGSAMGEKLPIHRWSFWVFNHNSTIGADNESQCRLLRDSIGDAQIKVADTVIADCTNYDEVSENLIGAALSYLSENIERNDLEYAGNLQAMLKSVVQNMKDFMQNVRDMLKSDDDFDRDSDTFDVLFEDLWESLRDEMQNYVGEDSALRAARNEPYIKLKDEIEKVLDDENTQDFPLAENDIKRASRGEGGIWTAYQNALHYLRTRLSGKLQFSLDRILDELLTEMKSGFTKIFAGAGKLEGRFHTSGHELLSMMTDCIITSGESGNMPTLLRGLQFLDGWTMTYRSFIQHRLRRALNVLDPEDDECKEKGTPKNAAQAVEILKDSYSETIYKVRQALDGIYTEPNEAAFAVAEEFKDIMIRSTEIRTHSDDDKENNHHRNDLKIQWRRFYRPIRGDVWPDDYGHSQRRRDVSAKLRAPAESLLSLLKDSTFDFMG